ncbi:MAG: Crp/Fnr family transcriptional regulator [Alphaproteobacteria bacterium]|nr:Crp/Fnr family transcriptional regulator [Alphaproteobacteria bacterium]
MAKPTEGRVSCEACPLRKRETYRPFSKKELSFVSSFKAGELTIQAGATLFEEGTDSAHIYTVLSGWAFRYKLLENGERQILNFALPGDLLGLQAMMLGSLEHSVESLTTLTLCVFERARIWELYQEHPSLAFDLTWIASREERLLDETLLSVGRRSAAERIAHLLLLIYDRATLAGLATRNRVRLPITQYHLADALGLSLVHTNKTLRKLVNDGYVSWQGGELVVLKKDELIDLAGYDVQLSGPRPFI